MPHINEQLMQKRRDQRLGTETMATPECTRFWTRAMGMFILGLKVKFPAWEFTFSQGVHEGYQGDSQQSLKMYLTVEGQPYGVEVCSDDMPFYPYPGAEIGWILLQRCDSPPGDDEWLWFEEKSLSKIQAAADELRRQAFFIGEVVTLMRYLTGIWELLDARVPETVPFPGAYDVRLAKWEEMEAKEEAEREARYQERLKRPYPFPDFDDEDDDF